MILCEGINLEDDEEWELYQLPAFSDPARIAELIVDEFETLPWTYDLVVRGPSSISHGSRKHPFDVQITDSFRLRSSEKLRPELTFRQENQALDDWVWSGEIEANRRYFALNSMYFCLNYKGYVARGRNCRAIDYFEDEIRAFYGACLAHGLFRPYSFYATRQSFVYFAARDSEPLEPHGTMSSDVNEANYYMAGWTLYPQFRAQAKIESALSPVISLFNCHTHQRLKTAAIWLLRAEQSEKPLDKVLEAAIALEVLLGDREMSDKLGLTRLMANRCAYALGASAAEREDILQFFFDFYKLRSDIVHTGRLAMDQKEARLVQRGLELASSMLKHEHRISCQDE